MVVTHTGIENNSVVELDYTMETKPGFMPGLMLDEVLALDAPIKDLTVRVIVPENQHVNFKLLNSEGDVQQSQNNSTKIFTWHLTDLPAIPPERKQAHGKYFPRFIENLFTSIIGYVSFIGVWRFVDISDKCNDPIPRECFGNSQERY